MRDLVLYTIYLIFPYFYSAIGNTSNGSISNLLTNQSILTTKLKISNTTKAFRKEYRRLTDEERNRFHAAMNKLKTDTVEGYNYTKYEVMAVLYNLPEYAPGAYFGPAFLPWHREQLKRLEQALRAYDENVAIPYWDSTLDEGLPNPRDSILWTEEFLGNGDGNVTTGPFRNWTVYLDRELSNKLSAGHIMRRIGDDPAGALYSTRDIENVLNKSSYAQLTFCVDPTFEAIHGALHVWVGGHMLDMRTAPNDPVFFLLYSFIDWIWEQFRQQKQNKIQREIDYPSDHESCNSYHFFNATMKPFPLLNSDGLSSSYAENFYSYEHRPECTPNGKPLDGQCGSPYLVCDRKHWRCLSKIKTTGNCTGFENAEEEICYKSKCIKGTCRVIG